MDLEPDRREHNMARWTFAGGVGVVLGPLALAGFAWAGLGWRSCSPASRSLALVLVLRVRRSPETTDAAERPRLREALRAIRRREVFRWLFLLELSDLLGDVLLGFLALYSSTRSAARRRQAGWRSRSGAAPACRSRPR